MHGVSDSDARPFRRLLTRQLNNSHNGGLQCPDLLLLPDRLGAGNRRRPVLGTRTHNLQNSRVRAKGVDR